MGNDVYSKVKEFKRKYPLTISWRLKAHSKIIDKHLNDDEYVKYAFVAQKNASNLEIFTTYVIVLTNKRILLGQKRVFFGYFFTAITPDMFNDLKVQMGIIWGTVRIDTVKEKVTLSNIQKKALPEIENCITEYMMREKKKYYKKIMELDK
ncbi:MAG: PH domain-containing protein [Bacilli bacterium]|nr:PH domain-containing protein [Bacilli bacterium]MDD4718206.1 PH domain-containing protein [Bacilli bacterium]